MRKRPFVWRDNGSSEGGASQAEEGEEEEEDEGDEEEIEERGFNRAHALRTLKSLRVGEEPQQQSPPPTPRVRGGGGGRAVDDMPRVPLKEHFAAVYNELAKNRYGDTGLCTNSSISESDSSSDSEHSIDESRKRKRGSDSDDNDTRKRSKHHHHNERKPPQPPPPPPLMTVEERRRRRRHCFLCSYGDRYHDGIDAKSVLKMFDMMNNYGGCDNEVLAQHLVLYYRKYVYKPGLGLPMFTQEDALEHIEHHTLAAQIFLGESIHMLLEVRLGLEQLVFKQNGRHDKDALNGLIQVQKLLNRQYTLRPEQMIFNMGKSSDDLRKQGQFFNFMPVLKERADRNARVAKEQERLNQKFARLARREQEEGGDGKKKKKKLPVPSTALSDEYDI